MKINKSVRTWSLRLGVVLLILPILLLAIGVSLADAPPDPPPLTMAISLPDGSTAPLGEVLAMGEAQAEAEAEAGVDAETDAVPSEDPTTPETETQELGRHLKSPQDRDPYRLGRDLADKGKTEEAIALLRSVPTSHPEYARAQRFLGWDLYTRELNEPEIGLGFINNSIRRSPLEGNAWQDYYRAVSHSIFPKPVADQFD